MEKDNASVEYKMFTLVGGYGPWQRRACVFLFYMAMMNTFYNFSIIFMTAKEDYWCISPESESLLLQNTSLDGNSSSDVAWADGHSKSQCWVDSGDGAIDKNNENPSNTSACTKWAYSAEYHSKTIISEWDLVCSREWLVSFSKSIYMFGFMFCFLSGYLSDWFGRLPVAAAGAGLATFASILSMFSTSYTMFVVLRFLVAFGRITLTTTGYVILMEIADPKYREKLSAVYHLGYAFGSMIIPGIAFFIRRWSWLILTIDLLNIPVLCIFWLLPESPRWLLTHRKSEKLFQAMERAAELNGKKISHHDVETLLSEKFQKNNKKNFIHLVKLPEERRKLLMLFLIWMTTALVSYTMSYNVGDLAGSLYLNMFLIGLLEASAKATLLFVIHGAGRRKFLFSSMLVAGISLIATGLFPSSVSWLATTFAMVVSYCVSFAFTLLYLFTAETFATVVRNAALASCSTSARIGGILAPFTRELGKATHPIISRGMVGGLAIVSGLVVLALPETQGKALKDTLEDETSEYEKLNKR